MTADDMLLGTPRPLPNPVTPCIVGLALTVGLALGCAAGGAAVASWIYRAVTR
ncbi:MAG: hypothetical protein ACSLFP_04380 [Acidimicrobiales bacterium]